VPAMLCQSRMPARNVYGKPSLSQKDRRHRYHNPTLPPEQWHTLIKDAHPATSLGGATEEILRRLAENAPAAW